MTNEDNETQHGALKPACGSSNPSHHNPFGDDLPPLQALETFPDYPFYQCCERGVTGTLTDAVNVALDFTRQCMDCDYPVGSVVGQEIFTREQNPYRFIVWQDVSKQILPKLHVKSSSFAEVRLFGNATRDHYLIDTKSLDKATAERAAQHHRRRSAPAFAVLHSRWTFHAQPDNTTVKITLEAGGRTSGIANLIPKPILRHELKNVIEESLRFYDCI